LEDDEGDGMRYSFADHVLQTEFYRIFVNQFKTKIQSFLWTDPQSFFCDKTSQERSFELVPIPVALIHSDISFLSLLPLVNRKISHRLSLDLLLEIARHLNKSSVLLRLSRPILSSTQLGRSTEETFNVVSTLRRLSSPFDLLLESHCKGNGNGNKTKKDLKTILFDPEAQKLLLSQLNSVIAHRLS